MQPLLSSSYIGFGTSSLKTDAEELGLLLEHLRSKRGKKSLSWLAFQRGATTSSTILRLPLQISSR